MLGSTKHAGFHEIESFINRLIEEGAELAPEDAFTARRAAVRYVSRLALSVQKLDAGLNPYSEPQPFESQDISEDGVSFWSDVAIDVGQQLRVTIVDEQHNSLDTIAYVRHCTPSKGGFCIGALFIFDE